MDRFKSINDKFGYADADALLRRIADQLRNAAEHFFADGAAPYRAHGDEFYLGGNLTDPAASTPISETLDRVRDNVAAIKVGTVNGLMGCTVSIGWLTSKIARESTDNLQERAVRRQLEEAVAAAKHQRNAVVQYSTALARAATREGRADCPACHCKFTASVPIDEVRADDVRCPNCGTAIERPHGLQPAPQA